MRLALVVLASLLLAPCAAARTFTFHAPTGRATAPGACDEAVFTRPADVVELRAWVTNFTAGHRDYGVRYVFFTDVKWWWTPWRPHLDGKAYRITTPRSRCAVGDSCELRLKTKGQNGSWSCWTTSYWRETGP